MTVQTKTTVAYGINAIRTILSRSPDRILRLYVNAGRQDDRLRELLELARKKGVEPVTSDRKKLDQLSGGAVHQSVVAMMKEMPIYGEDFLEQVVQEAQNPLLMILDGVTDPHNLGACFRSAAAAGATALILPTARSVSLTPASRKVASGGDQFVPLIRVPNLARVLDNLKNLGLWVIGLDAHADASLYEQDLKAGVAFVLGGEASGLRSLTRKKCDVIATIPMMAGMESLNVAVTAGICLFETVRQRRSET